MYEYDDVPQHEVHDEREPFAILTHAAFERWREDKQLTPSCLLVYVALIFRANSRTYSCFPSVRTIADDCGITERTARLALQSLASAGLIRIEQRLSGDRQTTNLYRILRVKTSGEGEEKGRGEGAKNDTPGGAKNDTPVNYTNMNQTKKELDGLSPAAKTDEPQKSPQKSASRRQPLAEDWLPDQRTLAWCWNEDYQPEDIERELPKFRDHHRAKGNVMVNWDLAFRNWMRNSRGFARPLNGNGHQATGPALRDRNGNLTAAGWALRAKELREQGE